MSGVKLKLLADFLEYRKAKKAERQRADRVAMLRLVIDEGMDYALLMEIGKSINRRIEYRTPQGGTLVIYEGPAGEQGPGLYY